MERPLLEQLYTLSAASRWEDVLQHTREVALDERPELEASQILFFEGLALLHLDQPADARQAVMMGLEYASNRPELLDLAARVSVALGRASEAAVFHERAIANASAPLQPLLLMNYAATLFQEGNFADALRCLRRTGDEERLSFDGHVLAGRCFASLGRHRDALSHFRTAREEHPNEVAPRLGIANALAALGEFADADTDYAILAMDSLDPSVTYNWAVARLTSGDSLGTVNLCRKMTKLGAGSPAVTCMHAKALLEMGAVDAALNLLGRGLDGFFGDAGRIPSGREGVTLYDEFAATEAETIAESGESGRARSRIVGRIRAIRGHMARCFPVLALMNDPPATDPEPFHVTASGVAGQWVVHFDVLAPDDRDALALAAELLPDIPENPRRGSPVLRVEPRENFSQSAMEGLPPVRGVLARRFDLALRRR
jgi:tetratricopeptide (TPR) repeat protein